MKIILGIILLFRIGILDKHLNISISEADYSIGSILSTEYRGCIMKHWILKLEDTIGKEYTADVVRLVCIASLSGAVVLGHIPMLTA